MNTKTIRKDQNSDAQCIACECVVWDDTLNQTGFMTYYRQLICASPSYVVFPPSSSSSSSSFSVVWTSFKWVSLLSSLYSARTHDNKSYAIELTHTIYLKVERKGSKEYKIDKHFNDKTAWRNQTTEGETKYILFLISCVACIIVPRYYLWRVV